MLITWKGSDDYHYTSLPAEVDKKAAIQAQILKILELSEGKENWNVVTLDKWIDNLGRLIGHIQNDQEAVGYDKGYRVAVQFLDYYDALETAFQEDDFDEYDDIIWESNKELDGLVAQVAADTAFKTLIQERYRTTPFLIEIADRGQRIGLTFDLFA